MASFRIKTLAQIALNQAKLDFSGSALRERYLRKVTTIRLKKLNLTPDCEEFQEAYALAIKALQEKVEKKKERKGFFKFLFSSPKAVAL